MDALNAWANENTPMCLGIAAGVLLMFHLMYQRSIQVVGAYKERYNSPQYMLPQDLLEDVYDDVGNLKSRVNQEITNVFRQSSVVKRWKPEDIEGARQAALNALSAVAATFSAKPTNAQLYRAYNAARMAFQDSVIQTATMRGDPLNVDEPLRLTRGVDYVALSGANTLPITLVGANSISTVPYLPDPATN